MRRHTIGSTDMKGRKIMTNETFDIILNRRIEQMRATLSSKAKEYAPGRPVTQLQGLRAPAGDHTRASAPGHAGQA